ncbi:MAG: hypothetical protein JWL73_2014 [Actinomycetia bacterium]|nr:hypothetical protein [Actinomycetes bacterium]
MVLRHELGRRLAAFVGLALIVTLGGGLAIGSLVAADRTHRAYTDYVAGAKVSTISVNPSFLTAAIDHAMRRLPSVAAVHSDTLFNATASPVGAAASAEDLLSTDGTLQVRGSTDGRYQASDRPIVTDGRFATGTREVFVTDDYRPVLETSLGHRVSVGDTVPMRFYWGPLGSAGFPLDPYPKPIGTEHLRIAGFGRLSDEVLPDELYPRQRMIVSADVTRKYSCLADVRPDMTVSEAMDTLYPRACSTTYKFYSLQLRPGRTQADVRREFSIAAAKATTDIPRALTDMDVSYAFLSQDRADIDQGVRHVTRPTVTALLVFGLVAAGATLAITALALSRILRRSDAQQRTFRAIGATRTERALIGAGPPSASVVAGLIGTVPVALLISVVGPAGTVRDVDPRPAFSLPGRVVLPAIAIFAALLFASVAAVAWSAATRANRNVDRRGQLPWVGRLLAGIGRPAAAQGIRTSLGGRDSNGGAVVLVGCVVALAAVSAAVVFGTNLNALVRDPTRYGWSWNAAVITNAGYGDTRPAKVAKSLDHNPAVVGYSLLAFEPGASVAGRPVPTLYGFTSASPIVLPLIRGRQATSAGEAVLGHATSEKLGVSIGDRVRVRSQLLGRRSATVVGIGVLPSLGPLVANRTGLGTGAYVVLNADPASPRLGYPVSFTAIRLRPGTAIRTFLDHLRPAPDQWDSQLSPPYTYAGPVRPPEIVNAGSMRTVPLALGGVLGLGLMTGLTLFVGTSVRDRRRELAVLRALGFSRRELRATVAWQAATTVGVGLVIGIPVGAVAGRFAWRAFADQLGVVPHADIPFLWLTGVAVGALALALLAAAPPARAATRIKPSTALDDEP